MRKTAFLTALLLTVNVFFGLASALVSVEQQENLLVTAEEGRSIDFLIVVQNDAGSPAHDSKISVSGDIAPWTSFEGSGSYSIEQIPAFYFAFVPVRISVPEGTDMGEYTGEITAGGSVISGITVRVVLSVPDTELLQQTSGMDEEISRLRDELDEITTELGKRIDLNREDLVRQIFEMSEYNIELGGLINNKQELEEQITLLQSQLDDMENEKQEFDSITARVSAGNSLNLAAGILFGAFIVFLVLRRRQIADFFKNALRPSGYKMRKWKG